MGAFGDFPEFLRHTDHSVTQSVAVVDWERGTHSPIIVLYHSITEQCHPFPPEDSKTNYVGCTLTDVHDV